MPYRQVYFDAPKDESLPVYKELPEGYTGRRSIFGVKEAHRAHYDDPGAPYALHWCDRCGGWIPSNAECFQENTLAPHMLAGRSGHTYYCRRCGREVAFIGIMS